MIYLVIATILGVILSAALLWYSGTCRRFDEFSEALGIILATESLIGLLFIATFGFQWAAAGHKAEMLNREFGTRYTQSEVFYAEDVIDEIRQIKRQRIEVNGDLLRGEE